MSKELIVTGDLRLMKLSKKKKYPPKMRWIKVTPRSHCREEGGGGSWGEKAIGWAALLHWEYKQKNSKRVKGEKS